MANQSNSYRPNQLGMLILAFAISILLAPGIPKLSFDDEFRNIFRFDSEVYRNYQELLKLFPDSESDFVLIVSGAVFDPGNFTRVVTLVDLLSGLPGASNVLSIGSLPMVEDLITDPFTLERFAPIDAGIVAKLEAQNKTDPAPFEFLVSANLDAQLIFIRLDTELVNSTTELKQFKRNIDASVMGVFGADAADILIAGAPGMKIALHDQATLDTVRLNIIATILATIVALLLFRSTCIRTALSSIGRKKISRSFGRSHKTTM
jgi:predicted RND superfamily exporter protein